MCVETAAERLGADIKSSSELSFVPWCVAHYPMTGKRGNTGQMVASEVFGETGSWTPTPPFSDELKMPQARERDLMSRDAETNEALAIA
jgi:hypothetical protein